MLTKKQIVHGVPYPAVYQPRATHSRYEAPLFQHQLRDRYGNPVEWDSLKGMSVALLFGMGDLRHFRNCVPWLINYYERTNENSDRQKLEIVYVPLDQSRAEFKDIQETMPWLVLQPVAALVELYQRHYRIHALNDRVKSAHGTLMRPPALTIISGDGSTFKYIDLKPSEGRIRSQLSKWDYDNCIF